MVRVGVGLNDRKKLIARESIRCFEESVPVFTHRIKDYGFLGRLIPNEVGHIVVMDDDFSLPRRRDLDRVLDDLADIFYRSGHGTLEMSQERQARFFRT